MAPVDRPACWRAGGCFGNHIFKRSSHCPAQEIGYGEEDDKTKEGGRRETGFGCAAYEIESPTADPSPSSRWNPSCSCGVVMTSTSRMPASISVDSG